MGEAFRKVVDWVKAHKVLAIALSGGILVLVYLWRSSQNAAAQAAAAQVQSGPSDQILSQEIAAQAALQQEQIAAQAQGLQYQYAAQVDVATIQAQAEASNAQNQAALTLGLAQAGNSTQSILELLGAQPGIAISPSAIGNTTTSPSAGAVLTGAAPVGGTGSNQQTNPAPAYTLPPTQTPIAAAAARDPSQPQTMNYYDLLAQAGLQSCDPLDSACVANDAAKQAAVETYWAAHEATGVPEGTTITVSPLTAGQVTQFYDPSNPYSGGNVVANVAVVAQPAHFGDATLATGYGTRSVISPSVIRGSGSHAFFNAPTGDVIHTDGTVDAGAIMDSVSNASAVDRSAVLANWGIQNAAGVQSGIAHMMGVNEPMTHTGVS